MVTLSTLLNNNFVGFTGSTGGNVTNAETAPENPVAGQMWFNTSDGSASVWYDDGTNAQWISMSGPIGPIGYTGSAGFVGSRGSPGSMYASVTTVTGNRTLTEADANNLLLVTSALPVTITIPTDATFNFPIGTTIHVAQDGAGQVTIGGQVGVTVRIKSGSLNSTASQYSIVAATKMASNYWYLSGDLQ